MRVRSRPAAPWRAHKSVYARKSVDALKGVPRPRIWSMRRRMAWSFPAAVILLGGCPGASAAAGFRTEQLRVLAGPGEGPRLQRFGGNESRLEGGRHPATRAAARPDTRGAPLTPRQSSPPHPTLRTADVRPQTSRSLAVRQNGSRFVPSPSDIGLRPAAQKHQLAEVQFFLAQTQGVLRRSKCQVRQVRLPGGAAARKNICCG